MSVVKINAISVPAERWRSSRPGSPRARGEVSSSPGFEAFELLRPTDEKETYLVYTRWASEDDFQAWVASPAFAHGHRAHGEQGPVSAHSELWQFEVIQHEDAPANSFTAAWHNSSTFTRRLPTSRSVPMRIAGVIALIAWRCARRAVVGCGSSRSWPSR
jgi:heme-degrading monooxygenase HmoA